jgi:hypothetical protein
MTREQIKQYILTKVTYDYITTNYILSKWHEVKDIETVKSLEKEIPSLYVDQVNKRFRLRRRIK